LRQNEILLATGTAAVALTVFPDRLGLDKPDTPDFFGLEFLRLAKLLQASDGDFIILSRFIEGDVSPDGWQD
jgi:hypothetical protein